MATTDHSEVQEEEPPSAEDLLAEAKEMAKNLTKMLDAAQEILEQEKEGA